MSYGFIDARKAEHPVSRLCHVLGVSQSGYHAWRTRGDSLRRRQDRVLEGRLRIAFAQSRQAYGSPRLMHELREQGFVVGRRRVARLMRESGLKARPKRRFIATTDAHHADPVAPNLLMQHFGADRPDQKWASDITYVWTRQGFVYLAVVLDLYARRIIGHATSDRLDTMLALTALNRAIALRRIGPGLIHHSDRGNQYCAKAYRSRLRQKGIAISMSAKGNAYDNAMVESFFKTLKTECIWRHSFDTKAQAARAIADYIDNFYNPTRRHQALGYISPVQFERTARP
jgi:putative transposase